MGAQPKVNWQVIAMVKDITLTPRPTHVAAAMHHAPASSTDAASSQPSPISHHGLAVLGRRRVHDGVPVHQGHLQLRRHGVRVGQGAEGQLLQQLARRDARRPGDRRVGLPAVVGGPQGHGLRHPVRRRRAVAKDSSIRTSKAPAAAISSPA